MLVRKTMTSDERDDVSLQLERDRLELDRARFELDREKASAEQRFANRYFAAILAAAVTLATALIFMTQVWVAEIDKQKTFAVEEMQHDRQWRLQAAKLIIEHRDLLAGGEPGDDKLQQVIGVAFPPDIAATLVNKIHATEPGERLRRFWKPDGLTVDTTHASQLLEWMKRNGVEGSLTFFLHSATLADARRKALADLSIGRRVFTLTDVSADELDRVTADLKARGSTVSQARQPNGRWTITAIAGAEEP
jgi:hypothetical protein